MWDGGLKRGGEGTSAGSLCGGPAAVGHLWNGVGFLLGAAGTSALSSHLAGQNCHVGLWLFNEAHPRGPGPRQGSLSSAGAC